MKGLLYPTAAWFLGLVCSVAMDFEEGADDPARVAIRMVRVDSTLLEAVGYDARTRTMELVYDSGSVRRFLGVPPEVYRGLRHAPSKGRYYHRHVRGRYASVSPTGRMARR